MYETSASENSSLQSAPMTQEHKFRDPEDIFQRIVTVLTNLGTQVCHRQLDTLINLLRICEGNNDCRALIYDEESDKYSSQTPQKTSPCTMDGIGGTDSQRDLQFSHESLLT